MVRETVEACADQGEDAGAIDVVRDGAMISTSTARLIPGRRRVRTRFGCRVFANWCGTGASHAPRTRTFREPNPVRTMSRDF
jgi:hypothetical protein